MTGPGFVGTIEIGDSNEAITRGGNYIVTLRFTEITKEFPTGSPNQLVYFGVPVVYKKAGYSYSYRVLLRISQGDLNTLKLQASLGIPTELTTGGYIQ